MIGDRIVVIQHYFVKNVKKNNDAKILLLEKKKKDILDNYKLSPTNLLVSDFFDIQEQLLKKDERMSYHGYCQKEVQCICCDKNIQFNNLDKHTKSLGHINKLPIKDNELNKKTIQDNKNKQKSIKANRIIKLYRSEEINKDEFNTKMEELGVPVRYK